MSAALCLALLAAAPPDDGVDWAKATPQEWAVRLSVASGFGADGNRGDLADILQEIAALGPRARTAAPALLEVLAERDRSQQRLLIDQYQAFEALSVDGVPAAVAAITSDDPVLRRVGLRAAGRILPRDSGPGQSGPDPALVEAFLAAVRPGLNDPAVAADFLTADQFLSGAGAPAALAAVTLADDPSAQTRAAACRAIAAALREPVHPSPNRPAPSVAEVEARAACVAAMRAAATDDQNPAVRDAAIDVLAQLGEADDLVVERLVDRVLAFGADSESAFQLFGALDLLNRYPHRAAEIRAAIEPRARALVAANPKAFLGTASTALMWGPDSFGLEQGVGPLVEDERWRYEALETLRYMGPVASSQLPRLVPLLGEAGAEIEATGDGLGDRYLRRNVAWTVAAIDPSHPALPDVVFPMIPEIPADLPAELPAGATAAERAAWSERWTTIERELNQVSGVVSRMRQFAAPALPRLRPHLLRPRGGEPDSEALGMIAAIGPLPDDLLPVYASAALSEEWPSRAAQEGLQKAGGRALPFIAAALSAVRPADRDAADRPGAGGLFGTTPADDRYPARPPARTLTTYFTLRTVARMPPADLTEHRDALTAALLPLTRDEDFMVKSSALAALREVRPTDPAGFLAAADDPDPRTRGAAVRALATYGNAAGVKDALAAALRDDYATVRLPAVRAWRAAGFDEAALAPLRDDPNPAVQLAAWESGSAGT